MKCYCNSFYGSFFKELLLIVMALGRKASLLLPVLQWA